MAYSKGDLLSVLQKSARSGSLLASCEPEVQELMHQIDVLISAKQRECGDQLQALRAQLGQRERDLSALRVALQERCAEVERLQQLNSSLLEEHKAKNADSEAQVLRLRGELSRLSHHYEQMKAKRTHSQRKLEQPVKQDWDTRYSELQQQLGRKEEQLKTLESASLQKDRSLQVMRETVRNKDELIRSLQDHASHTAQLSSLQRELAESRERVRAQLGQEKKMREEIAKLKQRHESCKHESSQWELQYNTQVERFEREKAELEHRHALELQELKLQLSRVEGERSLKTVQEALVSRDCHRHTTTGHHLLPPVSATTLPTSRVSEHSNQNVESHLLVAATSDHDLPSSLASSNSSTSLTGQDSVPLEVIDGASCIHTTETSRLQGTSFVVPSGLYSEEMRTANPFSTGLALGMSSTGPSALGLGQDKNESLSHTLDGVLDRHFEKLDESLHKLLTNDGES